MSNRTAKATRARIEGHTAIDKGGQPRIGTKTTIVIPDQDMAWLDEYAARAGTTRSALIRTGIKWVRRFADTEQS